MTDVQTSPNEIQFRIGSFQVFVNRAVPATHADDLVLPENFVYPDRDGQAIRINREALLNNYDVVVRQVVSLLGVERDEVHDRLQEVLGRLQEVLGKNCPDTQCFWRLVILASDMRTHLEDLSAGREITSGDHSLAVLARIPDLAAERGYRIEQVIATDGRSEMLFLLTPERWFPA